mmetsp:Transcript_131/g.485  ORF Transcript_131/g.485 Transcript_131/m.485 type:complete len:405 (-) Transcript_131:281-1495(-)
MSGELSEPLDIANADTETLRAALHDREVQLRDAVALGNQLYEERAELERQLEDAVERESQMTASHRREVSHVHQQLHEAISDKEALNARVEELVAETREHAEAAEKYRTELERVSTTNEALRADVEHVRLEASLHATSRDGDGPTAEDDAADLKRRVQELQGELKAAKANATNLQVQRDSDRTNWQQQVSELREKLATATSDLERTRRDAAAERARLQAAVRDAQHSGAHPEASPMQRRSFGPSSAAPSVPRLQLEQAGSSDNKLDRDYEAFSARARGSSTAFVIGRNGTAQPGLQPVAPQPAAAPSNGSGDMRRASRRRLAESDSDEAEELAPVGASSPEASETRTRAASTARPRATSQASPHRPHHGTCPTCGRSDADDRQVATTNNNNGGGGKKGCPCVVM